MQVKVDSGFTAVHKCQLLTFTPGQVVKGDIASYLLGTGAAVTQLDVKPDEPAAPVDELDISGTIEQVLDWVGDNQDRALEASLAESEKEKPRPRLLGRLNEIMT